jgi:hypothetical protein
MVHSRLVLEKQAADRASGLSQRQRNSLVTLINQRGSDPLDPSHEETRR